MSLATIKCFDFGLIMDFPSLYYCFLGKVDKLLLFRLSNPTGQELGVCSVVIVSTSARSGLVMSASVSLTGRFLAVIQPVTAEPEHTSMTHLPITPPLAVSVFSSVWVCGSHLFCTYNPQSTTAKRRFCRRHNIRRLHEMMVTIAMRLENILGNAFQ